MSNFIGIKRIMRILEQLFANKWDSLDKTNRFLESHDLPTNQD